MKLRVLLLGLAALLGADRNGWTADARPGATNVIRRPVQTDKSVIDSFLVERGFRLELAASEPMVSSPVAMTFDENGRLFVVEMRDFPDRRGADPHLGRVRLLEAPNDDGEYQTSTVLADDLPLPSAIACYGGGVFVAAAPDIFYFKAGRSGGADVRKVVLTGLGGDATPTADALPNNFNWGLDGRIHGATAGLGGEITAPGWGGGSVTLAGCNFSFNPRTLEVAPEAGPSYSGLTFDNFGWEFVCDPTHPLRQAMYKLRYRTRNPFFPAPPLLKEVASPATEVFRFTSGPSAEPGPPAAVGIPLRRAQPVAGLTAAWLAQARGCVIYRGNAFPSNYLGNAFIADTANHIVHRAVLGLNGLETVALRAPNEACTEFLVSKDDWFRPVQVVNGPDGALYVADMQDGAEHGRIFRIVPENFKRPEPPQLGHTKTMDLVTNLANANGWHRDTAARLLFEQQDAAATPLLAEMAEHSRLPMVRVQALRALTAAGGPWETNTLKALRDPDARVRQVALQLSERLVVNGIVSGAIWEQWRALAADPEIRVRYQLAYTLGEARRQDRLILLMQILNRDLRNPFVQNAVLSSVSDGAAAMLTYLAGNGPFRKDPAGQEFLRKLATMIGVQGQMPEVTRAVNFFANAPLDWTERFTFLTAIGEGLRGTHSSLGLVDPQGLLKGFYSAALAVAGDPSISEAVRVNAVQLLGVSPYTYGDAGDWLVVQCTPQPFRELQAAALATLGRYDDPRVFPALLGNWPAMTPLLRQQAVAALLARTDRVTAVLDAVDKGRINATDVNSVERNFLRTCRDPAISRRAVELFGPVSPRRPAAVEQFKSALRLRGSADHGRQLYTARCAACHRPDTTGAALGPVLTGARARGRGKVLESILEPNANLTPGYAGCVVETKDGEILLGIKVEENPATITLRQARGPAVWARLNVDFMQTQSWSLMPDGLGEGWAPQDMADLLDWLMTGNLEETAAK